MGKTLTYLIGCVLLLSACDTEQTVKLVSPKIPNELLEPVPVPDREARTLRDIGLLVVDYDEALSEANSKIEATKKIVVDFNQRISKLE